MSIIKETMERHNMTEEKKQHGGARPGSGRKPKEEKDLLKRRTIRLTDIQYSIYKANGGSDTLRYLIENNKFKRD